MLIKINELSGEIPAIIVASTSFCIKTLKDLTSLHTENEDD